MATGQIKKVADAVMDRHARMLKTKGNLQAFLKRDVYRLYQDAQISRFQSVGNSGGTTSEGDSWPGLSSSYRKYKPRRFAKYPESGERMLIATGTLVKVVTGAQKSKKNPESGEELTHRSAATDRQLVVAIGGKYPSFVNETRPFMSFSEAFWTKVRGRLIEFVTYGK